MNEQKLNKLSKYLMALCFLALGYYLFNYHMIFAVVSYLLLMIFATVYGMTKKVSDTPQR